MITIKWKGATGRRNAPGSKREDFIPLVSDEPEDFQDLEEKEREERMTGLLDRYTARKRKRQVSSSSESNPTQAAGSNQLAAEGGSEMQAIVIPVSPEPGATDQTEPTGVAQTESKEADQVPMLFRYFTLLMRVDPAGRSSCGSGYLGPHCRSGS